MIQQLPSIFAVNRVQPEHNILGENQQSPITNDGNNNPNAYDLPRIGPSVIQMEDFNGQSLPVLPNSHLPNNLPKIQSDFI